MGFYFKNLYFCNFFLFQNLLLDTILKQIKKNVKMLINDYVVFCYSLKNLP